MTDFDVLVGEHGEIITRMNNPEWLPIHEMPAPPQLLSQFELGVIEVSGDKAVLLIIRDAFDEASVFVVSPDAATVLADGLANQLDDYFGS